MGETESSVVRKLTADGFVFVVGDSMANLNGFHVFSIPAEFVGRPISTKGYSFISFNEQ